MKTMEEHKKEKSELMREKIINEINDCDNDEQKAMLLDKAIASDDPVLIREVLTKTTLSETENDKVLKAFLSKNDSEYFTQQIVYLYFKDAESLAASFGSSNNFRDYVLSDTYLDIENIPKDFLDSVEAIAKSESNSMMIITRTMIEQHILPHINEEKIPVVNLHYNSNKSYRSR